MMRVNCFAVMFVMVELGWVVSFEALIGESPLSWIPQLDGVKCVFAVVQDKALQRSHAPQQACCHLVAQLTWQLKR